MKTTSQKKLVSLLRKQVFARLKDGSMIDDLLLDVTPKFIFLKKFGRIAIGSVRTIDISREVHTWVGGADHAYARTFPDQCAIKVQGYTCGEALDRDGACPLHGRVRFSHKSAPPVVDSRFAPQLSPLPPRRTRSGKTRPRLRMRR